MGILPTCGVPINGRGGLRIWRLVDWVREQSDEINLSVGINNLLPTHHLFGDHFF
jgi:hypothetical protein